MSRKLKYCIICEEQDQGSWQASEFIGDDDSWRHACGHQTSGEAMIIVDRNFGILYDLEVEDEIHMEPTLRVQDS